MSDNADVRVVLLAVVGGLIIAYGIFGMLAQTLGNFLIACAVLAVGLWMLWLAGKLSRKDREL